VHFISIFIINPLTASKIIFKNLLQNCIQHLSIRSM